MLALFTARIFAVFNSEAPAMPETTPHPRVVRERFFTIGMPPVYGSVDG